MLYIYLLEDLITDAITEEESILNTSEKENLSTGLFLLVKKIFVHENPKDRHVAPLGHIILIPSQTVFALSA
jgi:hypothetical protein